MMNPRLAAILFSMALCASGVVGVSQQASAEWGGSCEDLSGIGSTSGIGTDPTGSGAWTCDDYNVCNDTLIPWCACARWEYSGDSNGGSCSPP